MRYVVANRDLRFPTRWVGQSRYWFAKLVVTGDGPGADFHGTTEEVERWARDQGCYRVRHWIEY